MRILLLVLSVLGLFHCDDAPANSPVDATAHDTAGDANGDADTSGTETDGGTVTVIPGPVFEHPASQVHVRLADWGLTVVGRLYAQGTAFDFHTESARQGHCRLLTYVPAQCTPACDFQEACIDGVCTARAPLASAGLLQLTGVPGAPVEISPTTYGEYWFQSESITPATVTGDIGVTAPGDVVGAFDLTVRPVTPVRPTTDWPTVMGARAAGADVTLAWTNPVVGARMVMRMTTGIGTHGGVSPVEVECDAPDTGSLTIPGAYLDALYAGGWSCGECGGNDLNRYYASNSDSDPTVQLRAMATMTFFYHPNFQY